MDEAAIEALDTHNDFFVGCTRDGIQPMMPIGWMDKDKALRLAAWIVALMDTSPDHDHFNALLNKVQNL